MKKLLIALALVAVAVVGALLLGKGLGPAVADKQEPHTADQQAQRNTATGAVVGFADQHNTHAWLGIPFAAPPVGDLRWRAPQPAESWSGTREALSHGAPCTQLWGPISGIDGEEGEIAGAEDCLYLNIRALRFAPDAIPQKEERLPVMVWIHGGGNSIGTANTYPGQKLSGTQKIVYVALNYRLGLHGWFSHPALRNAAANTADASGNFGTLDVIAALQWVQQNIAYFGGDPNNVTLFGESAGGRDVYAMLASPLAKGLFHKAISQSGSAATMKLSRAENFLSDKVPSMQNSSNEVFARLLMEDGKAIDQQAAKALIDSMLAAEAMRYLRAKSSEELLHGTEPLGMGLYPHPQNFRDGHVLPEDSLLSRFADRSMYNSVPMILGTNRDEQKPILLGDSRFAWRLFGVIPRIKDEEAFERFTAYFSDQWKALAVDEPAMLISEAQGGSVFAYRFDWDEGPSSLLTDFSKLLGAGHGLEISYVFGDFDKGISMPFLFSEENKAGRMAADTKLDQAQRCELYAQLFLLSYQATDFWSDDEYASLGDAGCKQYNPYSFEQ